jgi:hypothetical protein
MPYNCERRVRRMRENGRNVGYLRTLLMVHEGMRVN